MSINPFEKYSEVLDNKYKIYSLGKLSNDDARVSQLPYSIRVYVYNTL